MTTRLRGWACIGAALTMIAAIGCGDKTDNGTGTTGGTTGAAAQATGGGAGKPFKITMIAKSQDNPVFQSAKTGAEAAAKDLSKAAGREIQIDWRTPVKEDAQQQADSIKDAVNGGTDVVLISCSDAAKVTGAIDDAVAQNVPVMTFDSDAPKSKRFAFYGVDDIETGQRVMQELAKIKNGKGNVAILAGNPNAPNLQNRVKGVKDEAAKSPGFKIVGVFNHNESPQDASAEVAKDMNAYPQIDCWAMIGGWPLFNTSLLRDLDPKKVVIVAVDALPDELAYVDKGLAPVLLAQPTYKWGYESVKIIVDHVLNKKDVPVINKMDLVRVDKTNLNTWAKQLKAWGFEKINPDYLK